ncbi:hypothetical protein [Pseudomonas fluorescens]|uniref:hypothetical protein n=1 Tax=Pseudomonas fluorescens TaxID=294 RepID=UPI0012DA9A94|nr:hypothetical protein [Pseudomonas fluorescens]
MVGSNQKPTSGNKAVEGRLSVKVNGGQEELRAFSFFDIGGSLTFQFGDANSVTGVVSTRFPKDKLGQEVQQGAADVNVSYRVNGEFVSWSGGNLRVAEDGAGGYEGNLSAVISAPGSSWNLTEGSFSIINN